MTHKQDTLEPSTTDESVESAEHPDGTAVTADISADVSESPERAPSQKDVSSKDVSSENLASEDESPAATEAESPADTEESTAPRGRRSKRWRPSSKYVATVSIVLLVAAGVLAGLYGWGYYSRRDISQAQDAARASACDFTKSLVTYDYRHLDDYYKAVSPHVTGTFEQFWNAQAPSLKQDLTAGEVTSQATKVTCGIASGGTSHAEIVVYIAQTVSSSATKGQQTPLRPSSVVVTTDRIGGRWLVSSIGPQLVP